jgi:uncharacterized protein (DUF1499 family)
MLTGHCANHAKRTDVLADVARRHSFSLVLAMWKSAVGTETATSPFPPGTLARPTPALRLAASLPTVIDMRVASAARPSPPTSTAGRVPRRSRDVTTRADGPKSVASRRAALLASLGVAGTALAGPSARSCFAATSPPPPEGDCPECVGVVNDLLNSCLDASEACVSSQNDDETHFAAPWAYPGNRTDAMRALAALVDRDTGKIDPVKYRGGSAKEHEQSEVSVSVDAYDETTGYVRLVVETGTRTIDARKDSASRPIFDVELLLWDDDEVVNVRCASRDAPIRGSGRWSLSYEDGLQFSRNSARDACESIRVALNWEILPVLSGFDPRFNADKRLWFEKALDFGGFSGRGTLGVSEGESP